LLWVSNEVIAANDNRKLPKVPSSPQWIPGPKSLLGNSAEITWEVLINNVLRSISDLNYSAKNDIKSLYIQQTAQIVRAIRDMLACSGTLSAESEQIRSNRVLATYHQNIMSSLSKIILAAKVAAGLWPPPDSVHSMRYQAGQVLLVVRHFVAVAQDAGITLKAASDEEDNGTFDLIGNELSDSELISRLDQSSDVIMNSIAALITKITRDKKISTMLVEQLRKTVTEIGQFMSLIEDIQFDTSSGAEHLVVEFKSSELLK
jgi:hypothetical protein